MHAAAPAILLKVPAAQLVGRELRMDEYEPGVVSVHSSMLSRLLALFCCALVLALGLRC